jgi:hypothetical protein
MLANMHFRYCCRLIIRQSLGFQLELGGPRTRGCRAGTAKGEGPNGTGQPGSGSGHAGTAAPCRSHSGGRNRQVRDGKRKDFIQSYLFPSTIIPVRCLPRRESFETPHVPDIVRAHTLLRSEVGRTGDGGRVNHRQRASWIAFRVPTVVLSALNCPRQGPILWFCLCFLGSGVYGLGSETAVSPRVPTTPSFWRSAACRRVAQSLGSSGTMRWQFQQSFMAQVVTDTLHSHRPRASSLVHKRRVSARCVCIRMPHPLATHSALRVACALHVRAWSSLFKRGPMFIDLLDCVGSVQDYWEGYKLFCYAYYSHSARHANEFRDSKLGALGLFAQFQLPFPVCAHCMFVNFVLLFLMLFFSGCMGPGQLVWRRLHLCPSPSPHAIRTTCMQLLPLVEMFCRWELQEDCSNLEVLMERFESVAELESHDLGRSLLCMVRDEDDGFRSYSERRHPPTIPQATVDAFHEVRQRLAAVDIAFQGLQPQVHIVVGHVGLLAPPKQRQSALGREFFFLRSKHCQGTLCAALLCTNCNTISRSLAYTCLSRTPLGSDFF